MSQAYINSLYLFFPPAIFIHKLQPAYSFDYLKPKLQFLKPPHSAATFPQMRSYSSFQCYFCKHLKFCFLAWPDSQISHFQYRCIQHTSGTLSFRKYYCWRYLAFCVWVWVKEKRGVYSLESISILAVENTISLLNLYLILSSFSPFVFLDHLTQ